MRHRQMSWLPAVASLLLISAPAAAGAQAEAIFPEKILFKIFRGNAKKPTGSFDLTFREELGREARFLITMENLEGLGYTSDQSVDSRIYQRDLSLYGHTVKNRKTGEVVWKVFLDPNCRSAIGGEKTRCFKYQDGAKVGLQTEIFDHDLAIDLVSSIVVVTREVATRGRLPRDFNLIFEKRMRPMQLVQKPSKAVKGLSGNTQAQVVAMRAERSAEDFLTFYIAHEKKRGYFPAKIVVAEDKGHRIELVADEVTWR